MILESFSKYVVVHFSMLHFFSALGSDDENEQFEQTLKQGVKATQIAGDAMNALHPVELHAVSNTTNHSSTIYNQEPPYGRPFTPDFSSIASNASDLSISTSNTPSKDLHYDSFDTTRTENSSFSSAVSARSSDIEATPTNDSTFLVNSREDVNSRKTDSSLKANTVTAQALVTTPKTTKETDKSLPNGRPNSSSFKLFNNSSKKNDSINNSSFSDSSRAFDNSAFMDDSTKTNGTDDGMNSFSGFGDEDDEFVSADGDFEELLV